MSQLTNSVQTIIPGAQPVPPTNTMATPPTVDPNLLIDWVRSGLAQALGRIHHALELRPDLVGQDLRAIHDTLMAKLAVSGIRVTDPQVQQTLDIRQAQWLSQYLANQQNELADYVNRRAARTAVTRTI